MASDRLFTCSPVLSVLSLLSVLSVPSVLSGSAGGVANLWNFQLEDYGKHICSRPCEDYGTPKLCHYDFLLENYYVLSKACYNCPFNQSDCLLPQCVSAGGLARVITTANRIMPGPAIQVCEGDTIEVKVTNMLDGSQGTAIHWHGILQRGTPHMDGTPMVTQCPTLMGSHFAYRFQAADVGTYFWHGHAGTQRADGLFGALIVRQPPAREPHGQLYDWDLPEHVMIVHDWLTVDSTDRLAQLLHIRENLDATILVNGMGQFKEFISQGSNTSFYTPRASFTVKPGFRYRFRVINSGILNCPLQLSIDNHTLTVIASDGSPVKPLARDSFSIFAGERYDFVLAAHTMSTPRNYWIRLRGLNSCSLNNVTQTAILKYEGAGDQLPPEIVTWDQAGEDVSYTETEPVVEQLQSLSEDDDIVLAKPDRKIFLHVDMVKVENLRAYNPPYYTEASSALFESPQINGISSLLPPAPPLTQLGDLPEEIFCNVDTVQRDCRREWCVCVHRHQLGLGELVELLILDDDAYHPLHLHGYKFRMVGYGKLEDGSELEVLQKLDYQGKLNRSARGAPLKDTVAAPIGGYTILRFRADNPGFWLFHCHLEFHMETGMMLIFQVGNSSQLPRRPKYFPVCASWDFQGYEDGTSSDGPGDRDNTCHCNVTCNNNYNVGRSSGSRCALTVNSRLLPATALVFVGVSLALLHL
ncbi:hypothetical protein BsWGS_24666 [Bradybaena similaris]